ncbi:MAG TPA: PilZ domain-containing protein [Bryobacteraceae bacterium]|nr:PilZ domain-containing protein [Bryobacteraceae bacterium]
MEKKADERRGNKRYDVRLSLRFRLTKKGSLTRWGSGTTCNMSTDGICFRSRRPLPVGSHLELLIEWPAQVGDSQPMHLQATGFVVWNSAGRTAVHLASRKFRVTAAEMPAAIRATA